MSKGFIAAIIISVVALVGGAISWKVYKRAQTFQESKVSAHDRFKYHRDLETDYINRMIDEFHEDAFSDSYSFGGLTSGAAFDEEKYYRTLITAMVERCEADNRPTQVETLEMIGTAYGYQAPAREPASGSDTEASGTPENETVAGTENDADAEAAGDRPDEES